MVFILHVSCPPGGALTYLFYFDVKFTVDLSSSEDLYPAGEMRNPIVVFACRHKT